MSIAELAGAPVAINFGDEKLQLPVLTLYELALAEQPYLASLRQAARIEASGLGPEALADVKRKLAEQEAALQESYVPVIDWMVHTLLGTLFGLHACLEARYPNRFTQRDVATWYHVRPNKGTDEDPVRQWMLNCRLLRNPTTPLPPVEAAAETMPLPTPSADSASKTSSGSSADRPQGSQAEALG